MWIELNWSYMQKKWRVEIYKTKPLPKLFMSGYIKSWGRSGDACFFTLDQSNETFITTDTNVSFYHPLTGISMPLSDVEKISNDYIDRYYKGETR